MKKTSLIVSLSLSALLLAGCGTKQASLDQTKTADQNIGIADYEVTNLAATLGGRYEGTNFSFESQKITNDAQAVAEAISENQKVVNDAEAVKEEKESKTAAAEKTSEAKAEDSTTSEKKTEKKSTKTENTTTDESAKEQSSTLIGKKKAKELAIAHTGVDSSQITFVKVELDWEDGRQVYEVEFYGSDYSEYDCEIDALTGEIISCDYDAEEYDRPVSKETTTKSSEKETTTVKESSQSKTKKTEKEETAVLIGETKAKNTALDHAGVSEGDINLVKVELDWEDGRQVYEIEFYGSDYTEYDYEIDALTGEILSYDHDAEDYDRPVVKETKKESTDESNKTNTSSVISKSEAKNIALAQVAGATESDIREFEKDYDDGKVVYEGTIVYGEMEYEFEIDGISGAILDWDAESVYDD